MSRLIEEWRPIEDYEDLYEVSDWGRVKSVKKGIILSLNKKDGNGYPQSSLWKNGKYKPIDNHILVAKAFIPNPENKPCIDHINGDKSDNRVENLRWVTYKENMANPETYKKVKGANIGRKHTDEWKKKMSEIMKEIAPFKGRHHTDEWKKKFSEMFTGRSKVYNRKKIAQIDMATGEVISFFDCINDAVKKGYTQSSISQCCQGKRKTHKGCIWKYA